MKLKPFFKNFGLADSFVTQPNPGNRKEFLNINCLAFLFCLLGWEIFFSLIKINLSGMAYKIIDSIKKVHLWTKILREPHTSSFQYLFTKSENLFSPTVFPACLHDFLTYS